MDSRGKEFLKLVTGHGIISPHKTTRSHKDMEYDNTENSVNTINMEHDYTKNSELNNITQTSMTSTENSSQALDESTFSEVDDTDNDPNYSSQSTSSSSSSCSSSSSSSTDSDFSDENDIRTDVQSHNSIFNENSDYNLQNTMVASETIVESNDQKKNTRKRIPRPSRWLKNEAKRLRSEGKEYVSVSAKKVMKAKEIRGPCKCQLKCYEKIIHDQRQQIFNDFYSIPDINRKRDFICRHLQTIEPKYRYTKSNRQLNNAYYFTVNNKRIRVCKYFFKATLDINDRVINTVLKKRQPTGAVSEDMRGKHLNHRKVDDEIKDDIREHINSIPKIESHYLRKQTTKDFIDGGKTIADLHRDYESMCKEKGKPAGTYHMYTDIFNTEFNISFYIPRKDQCNLCFKFKNSSDEEKEKIKEQYEHHQREKELSRIEKHNDKERRNENLVVVCYDMQAVFQTPKGETSIFYYKSKLNTMNLTVTDIGYDETFCYVWHEGDGGKGATEVCTCILKYLQRKAEKCNSNNLEIIMYSDNCVAQQKNRFLIYTLLYAVQKYKIKSITQKFLVVGHTQNEGDATHSVIEKQVSRALKSGPIYVPDQFITLIRTAKKRGFPYDVTELCYKDFIDVKQLALFFGNSFINTNNEKVSINDIRVLKVEKSEPLKVYYKNSYSEDQFKSIILKKTTLRKSEKNVIVLPNLKCAYKTKIPVNENKVNDLKYLLQNGYIPDYYSRFYNTIF